MNARVLTVVFASLLVFSNAAEKAADFEYGPRPRESVYDPGHSIDPQITQEIAGPLATIYKNEGIDVIVVVLADLDGAPPEHVAKRFAAAWCDTPIHAVVLHVPGAADTPWIVPAGKLISRVKPEVLTKDLGDAKRRAVSEPNDSARVRAAVNEISDKLRFWLATAINRSEYLNTERSKVQLELETKAKHWQVAMLTAAASAIPLLCGISALIYFVRKPGPRRFPSTQPPRRLGAPYAGGNHAVAEIGPPEP